MAARSVGNFFHSNFVFPLPQKESRMSLFFVFLVKCYVEEGILLSHYHNGVISQAATYRFIHRMTILFLSMNDEQSSTLMA